MDKNNFNLTKFIRTFVTICLFFICILVVGNWKRSSAAPVDSLTFRLVSINSETMEPVLVRGTNYNEVILQINNTSGTTTVFTNYLIELPEGLTVSSGGASNSGEFEIAPGQSAQVGVTVNVAADAELGNIDWGVKTCLEIVASSCTSWLEGNRVIGVSSLTGQITSQAVNNFDISIASIGGVNAPTVVPGGMVPSLVTFSVHNVTASQIDLFFVYPSNITGGIGLDSGHTAPILGSNAIVFPTNLAAGATASITATMTVNDLDSQTVGNIPIVGCSGLQLNPLTGLYHCSTGVFATSAQPNITVKPVSGSFDGQTTYYNKTSLSDPLTFAFTISNPTSLPVGADQIMVDFLNNNQDIAEYSGGATGSVTGCTSSPTSTLNYNGNNGRFYWFSFSGAATECRIAGGGSISLSVQAVANPHAQDVSGTTVNIRTKRTGAPEIRVGSNAGVFAFDLEVLKVNVVTVRATQGGASLSTITAGHSAYVTLEYVNYSSNASLTFTPKIQIGSDPEVSLSPMTFSTNFLVIPIANPVPMPATAGAFNIRVRGSATGIESPYYNKSMTAQAPFSFTIADNTVTRKVFRPNISQAVGFTVTQTPGSASFNTISSFGADFYESGSANPIDEVGPISGTAVGSGVGAQSITDVVDVYESYLGSSLSLKLGITGTDSNGYTYTATNHIGNADSYTIADVPTVTTQAASSIGATTALGNGTIVSSNGDTIYRRGFSWKLDLSATHDCSSLGDGYATNDPDGSYGAGAYTITLGSGNPLQDNSYYCSQAYATNGAGPGVGAWVPFPTKTLVAPPGSPSIGSISTTGFTVGWSDVSGSETGYKVFISTISSDNCGSATYPGTPDFTVDTGVTSQAVTGKSINTRYCAKVVTASASGDSAPAYSSPKYTLANIPGTPTVTSPTASSLTITINQNSNPSDTAYAIYNETASQYIQANGSLGASVAWQTYSAWGGASGIANTGLSNSTAYVYKVKARNSEETLTETALSVEASGTTLATIPTTPSGVTVGTISVSGFSVTWSDNANETGYKLYISTMPNASCASAIYPATPDYTPAANATSQSVSGKSPNTQYCAKLIATNTAGDSSPAYSSPKYTLANVPGAPTVSSPATNSLTITINQNSNPSNTTYAIYNETASQYIQANGLLGASAIWQTYSAWGGATGIVNTGLSVSTAYTYKVKAKNSEATPVETALSAGTSGTTSSNPPPLLQSITTSVSTGYYNASQNIPITLTFDRAAHTNGGNATVTLNTGGTCIITIASGSANTSISCASAYDVASGHNTGSLTVSSVSGTFYSATGVSVSNPSLNGVSIFAGKTITIDTVAPVITMPADLSTKLNTSSLSSPSFQVTDTNKNDAGCSWDYSSVNELHSVSFGSANSCLSQSFTMNYPNGISEAYYLIDVTASDLAGNQSTDFVEVRFDTWGPNFSITYPAADQRVNGDVIIQWAPTNDIVMANCSVNVQEAGTSCTTAVTKMSEVYQFNLVPDGSTFYLYVTALDALGNSSKESVFLTKDISAPVLAEVTPVPDPTGDTTPSYTFSSTEDGTIIYEGDCTSQTTSAVAGDNEIVFEELSSGLHDNCKIKVTDVANNQSNLLSISSFTIGALPASPSNLNYSSITTSGFTVGWTDNSADETGFKVYVSTLIPGNQCSEADYPASADYTTLANATSQAVTGKQSNMPYCVKLVSTNAAGDSTPIYTNNYFFTLATIPGAPTVGEATTNSLKIIINQNGNNSDTDYAIIGFIPGGDETARYIQADGTFGLTAVYQQYSVWGGVNGIVNTGLTANTGYRYQVAARNDDAVTTQFSNPTDFSTLDNPAISLNSITGTDGRYKAGANLTLTFTFNKNVTGNAIVTFNTTGACDLSITDSSTGSCAYTVQSNQNSNDLNVSSIIGTFDDGLGHSITDPTPATNLAANNNIVIDTLAPTITAATIISNNSTDAAFAKTGDKITLSFITSEQIGTPSVTIAGSSATIAMVDSTHYTAEITTTDSISDGVITFSIAAVTDLSGNQSSTRTSTTDNSSVTFDKTAPVVNAGTDKVKGILFTQDASVTETNINTYLWEKVSGPGTVAIGSAAAEDTTISVGTDGTYVIRLTVTDKAGQSANDSFELIWDSTSPTVNAGDDKAEYPTRSVTATATAENATNYAWSKVSGPGTVTFGSINALETTINADQVGTYTLRLTVGDLAGNTATDDIILTVRKMGDISGDGILNNGDFALLMYNWGSNPINPWANISGYGNLAKPDSVVDNGDFAILMWWMGQ